jgi:hypothetical protein
MCGVQLHYGLYYEISHSILTLCRLEIKRSVNIVKFRRSVTPALCFPDQNVNMVPLWFLASCCVPILFPGELHI